MQKNQLLALIPFAIILLAVLGIYFSGIYHQITFEMLKEEHLKWKAYADLHPFISSLFFLLIYIVSVVLILPDAILLTLLGGILFPLPIAIFYTCVAETVGATLFFGASSLAARSFHLENTRIIHEIERKIGKDQAYYLLFLRLSHLAPFWLVNLASGILHVRLSTFLWTTLVGVIPFAIIFSETGAGLSHYLDTHTTFHINEILNRQVKIALIIASLFSLLPIFFKKKKH